MGGPHRMTSSESVSRAPGDETACEPTPMTNRERILELIRAKPGLTDSEIRESTGIEPHQQVNQICRSLAASGLTTRFRGAQGRIVNHPTSSGSPTEDTSTEQQRTHLTHRSTRRHRSPAGRTGLPTLQFDECLFVLPCSGAKSSDGASRETRSVIDNLPVHLADELALARSRIADMARVDESTFLPAIDRYDGYLYDEGRPAIKLLLDRGARVLIISGGYGLVLPDEPIGYYSCVFQPKMWPDRLVERCLAAFAKETGVRRVVGILSATTSYATVFRRTAWPSSVKSVHLLTPEPVGGAMVKAPRAQGEVLVTITQDGSLPADWASTDGLAMRIERVEPH